MLHFIVGPSTSSCVIDSLVLFRLLHLRHLRRRLPPFFFLASRFIRQVYLFDGSTGVMVPPEAMTHNLTRNFTISLWLKHEHHAGQDKHVKEHILCNADDHRESSLAAH